MNELIIAIPSLDELQIINSELILYNYNFDDFSLAPVQKAASKDLYKKLSKNISSGKTLKKTMEKNDFEYVADISEELKRKIENGEMEFVIEKTTGNIKGKLRDTTSGRFAKEIDLEKRDLKDLGNLPELAAMQNQLNNISEQLENLNYNIKRVEQGQYNDRYAGFFSTTIK